MSINGEYIFIIVVQSFYNGLKLMFLLRFRIKWLSIAYILILNKMRFFSFFDLCALDYNISYLDAFKCIKKNCSGTDQWWIALTQCNIKNTRCFEYKSVLWRTAPSSNVTHSVFVYMHYYDVWTLSFTHEYINIYYTDHRPYQNDG